MRRTFRWQKRGKGDSSSDSDSEDRLSALAQCVVDIPEVKKVVVPTKPSENPPPFSDEADPEPPLVNADEVFGDVDLPTPVWGGKSIEECKNIGATGNAQAKRNLPSKRHLLEVYH